MSEQIFPDAVALCEQVSSQIQEQTESRKVDERAIALLVEEKLSRRSEILAWAIKIRRDIVDKMERLKTQQKLIDEAIASRNFDRISKFQRNGIKA